MTEKYILAIVLLLKLVTVTNSAILLRNDASTSVLLLTGTDGEEGVTGLTERHMVNRSFYVADCKGKKCKW